MNKSLWDQPTPTELALEAMQEQIRAAGEAYQADLVNVLDNIAKERAGGGKKTLQRIPGKDFIVGIEADAIRVLKHPASRTIPADGGFDLLVDVLRTHLENTHAGSCMADRALGLALLAPWRKRDGTKAYHRDDMAFLRLGDLTKWAAGHRDVPRNIHVLVAAQVGIANTRKERTRYDHGLNRLKFISLQLYRETGELAAAALYQRLATLYPGTTKNEWAERIRDAYRGGLPALRKDLQVSEKRKTK